MKKSFYALSIMLTVFIILGAIHCFVGNPVSEIMAGKAIDSYINENYPGWNCDEYYYDFTSNGYLAKIYLPKSVDMNVMLYTDTFGMEVVRDSYKADVETGYNTSQRLNSEYTELLNDIIGDEICGYKVLMLRGWFADSSVEGRTYSLKSGPLVAGKEYDLKEISATDGDILISVMAEDAEKSAAGQIFTGLKNVLTENGMAFDTVTVSFGDTVQLNSILYDGSNIPDGM